MNTKNTNIDVFAMTESDLCNVDNLTNDIMYEIRDVLKKNESHVPDWDNEDNTYNLYNCIYGDIHDRILNHKLANIAKYKNNHTHN